MSQQYDSQAGLDISSLASVSQAQLLQMVNQLGPLSNIGGVICLDGVSTGAAGVGFPDVTNNPRFVRYLWLDTNPGGTAVINRTTPVFKRYVGAYTGTPANPVITTNLYSNWVAVGVASGAILTDMLAPKSASGGVDITKLKRASDGSIDITKQYYIVRIDSAGQYVEIVSLDTALGDGGGVGLSRIATTGIGASKYLGYNAGVLGYKTLNPANDFTQALANRIPITTAMLPGTAKYLVRTNTAGTALEFVASNDATLFADLDILLSKLAASGAAADEIIKYNGANWVPVGFGSHLNSVANVFYPGTFLSNATKFIETAALATIPKMFRASIVCTTGGDGDYVLGDEIDGDSVVYSTGAYLGHAINLTWTAALKLRLSFFQSANFQAIRKDGTNIITLTAGSWSPKIIYWL